MYRNSRHCTSSPLTTTWTTWSSPSAPQSSSLAGRPLSGPWHALECLSLLCLCPGLCSASRWWERCRDSALLRCGDRTAPSLFKTPSALTRPPPPHPPGPHASHLAGRPPSAADSSSFNGMPDQSLIVNAGKPFTAFHCPFAVFRCLSSWFCCAMQATVSCSGVTCGTGAAVNVQSC